MGTHVHVVKFSPGEEVIFTAGLKRKMTPDYAEAALVLHLNGQWGMISDEGKARNEAALREGRGVIMSVFPLPEENDDFWVITDADHSVTTVLLPSEY